MSARSTSSYTARPYRQSRRTRTSVHPHCGPLYHQLMTIVLAQLLGGQVGGALGRSPFARLTRFSFFSQHIPDWTSLSFESDYPAKLKGCSPSTGWILRASVKLFFATTFNRYSRQQSNERTRLGLFLTAADQQVACSSPLLSRSTNDRDSTSEWWLIYHGFWDGTQPGKRRADCCMLTSRRLGKSWALLFASVLLCSSSS